LSTKKLARTVIEGGRRNVWERRFSTRNERAQWRDYLSRQSFDDEVDPRRQPVHPQFSDHLNPAHRWMADKDGRPWADVKSQIHQVFDGPWPNQHVVYTHLLQDVVAAHEPQAVWGFHRSFTVTPDGVFHRPDPRPSRYPNNHRRQKARYTYRSVRGLRRWLSDRRVEEHDGDLYWATPVEMSWEKCTNRYCKLTHHPRVESVRIEERGYQKGRDEVGYMLPRKQVTVNYHLVAFSYRKSVKLTERELQYWKTLHPKWKAIILEKKLI
jgi:hypothetical protein